MRKFLALEGRLGFGQFLIADVDEDPTYLF